MWNQTAQGYRLPFTARYKLLIGRGERIISKELSAGCCKGCDPAGPKFWGRGEHQQGPKCSSACGRSGDGAAGAEHHLGNGNSPGEQFAGLAQLPLPSAHAIKQVSVFRKTPSPKNICSAKGSSKKDLFLYEKKISLKPWDKDLIPLIHAQPVSHHHLGRNALLFHLKWNFPLYKQPSP